MKWEKIISEGKFLFFKNMHFFWNMYVFKIASKDSNACPKPTPTSCLCNSDQRVVGSSLSWKKYFIRIVCIGYTNLCCYLITLWYNNTGRVLTNSMCVLVVIKHTLWSWTDVIYLLVVFEIIITRARLRRVAGKSGTVSHVRFLLQWLGSSQLADHLVNEINQGPCYVKHINIYFKSLFI